tara:strand:+ start:291 stop:953 length:663 start_codon:yes stop_codon:yes gene_type:complete
MSTTVKVQIQQRIDTASAWTTANPTLLAGEIGWESDTKKYKIGDGSTAWASLTYPAAQTGAEIKTAYEAEANTNAYTDAEKSKLAAIEASATADQTAAEIVALVAAQTIAPAGVTIDGPYKQVSEAVGALDIDLSTGNYFTKTINADSTFTFSNPASSGTVSAFTIELTHTSGTVTWPTEVKFNGDSAPTLTTGKTHLFMFVTDDGGSRYRAAALIDYVN